MDKIAAERNVQPVSLFAFHNEFVGLINVGRVWRVPSGLPPKVYLKVTARDAAGNEKTVVTRDPILVDLVKPRAKVSGIVGPAGSPRQ